MSSLLDGPESRIVQIVETGRGITGSAGSAGSVFSAHAQVIAIPAGSFRRSEGKAPLEDGGLDGPAFDRAYDIRWRTAEDDEGSNELDGSGLVTLRVDVRVGILFGAGIASLIKAAGAEGSASMARPEARAFGIATQIKRAMTMGELYQGTDIDPPMILCERAGQASLTVIDGGRMMVTSTFRIVVAANLSSAYGP